MFGNKFISDAIERSAETPVDRRKLLTMAGIASAGAGAAVLGASASASAAPAAAVSDGSILNFALNLEYLEAEFYLRATSGAGLPDSMTTGTGTRGGVSGGRAVPFKTRAIKNFAKEIARDEQQHVAFLRSALGSAAVARPKIDIEASFSAAAQAAGVVGPGQKFDPYADELSFLFGAFLFEDVGVTAYKGAAPFIANKTYLEAAAGILAVEAYHGGIIRSALYNQGIATPAVYKTVHQLSDARDSLDGPSNKDNSIGDQYNSTVVPVDGNAIAYSRSTGQVLNIVYLNPAPVTKGGFFPGGVNGTVNTSADSR